MTSSNLTVAIVSLIALAACSQGDAGSAATRDREAAQTPELEQIAVGGDAAGGPADEGGDQTIEGRISNGAECPLVTTADGHVYSVAISAMDFGEGDYVRIEGERSGPSICLEGEGHILPHSIESVTPPAERAGGNSVKLTAGFIAGAWIARGGDCTDPAFRVTQNGNGESVVRTLLNGAYQTGYVDIGRRPAFRFDTPLPALSIAPHGAAGLTVMPAESQTVRLGTVAIEGEGVAFVKCGSGRTS